MTTDLLDRSAPAPRLKPRGSSQGGLRQYNERVVLHAIRLHGALPGADLARLTGLTAQTVSQISKRLLEEGLLVKGEPVRGKVGQPSVPLGLRPDGAFAVGVHVGRRSLDLVLVDFVGAVRERWTLEHDFPDPETVLAEIERRLKSIRRKLGPEGSERITAIGLAAPQSMGGWASLLGVDPAQAARWSGIELHEEVARRTGLPVQALKDTAAACVSELVAGRGHSVHSFLYLFVDTLIGGGLVLDSRLRAGLHGNAGAVGSLPLGLAGAGASMPAQLLSVASLLGLEQRWRQAGLAADALAQGQALQAPWREHTEAWLQQAGRAIAMAANAATCLLDLEGVIVDGAFDRELLQALLRAVEQAMALYSWEGVARPQLAAGTIGADARAIGAALLPLYANFAPDRDLFLKIDG
ncbi:ROK family transcriptional regulator [Azohydromonas caseinilytica]|uniref:ROK family transcriptional regulator n=1 Tax=Azohydromonas caseinilytica TaxID=2728836 RepID=UPI001F3E8C4F|nr:ROK family transcriptional regulator [Azohydromonas caseinilytica]